MQQYVLKNVIVFIGLILLIFLLVVSFPETSVKAAGGITFDAAATKDDGASLGSSLTWTHTVGSGSNVILLVSVTTDHSHTLNTTSGVTVDGSNMTKLTTATCPLTDFTTPAVNCHVELWYMTGVSTGAHTIVATVASGTSYMEAGSISFFNVDQTTPLGTANTNTGATPGGFNPTSVAVTTSNSNQVVLDVLGADNPASVGSGETQQWNDRMIAVNAGSTEPATGGTMTMSWNVNGGDWAEIGVPLNQVAPTPTPTATPTPTPTSTPTPTIAATATPTSAPSQSSTSTLPAIPAQNPNIKSGWSKEIKAGPNFYGNEDFIRGGTNAQAMTYIGRDSLHMDAYVNISPVSPNHLATPELNVPFPWMQGFNTAGDIYSFTAVSAFNGYPIQTFDKPVTVILKYDPNKLFSLSPQALRIARYDSSSKRWKLLTHTNVVNLQNHTIANTTISFSYFVVVYPTY